MQISTGEDRRFLAGGVMLGVALSGFFDGILLHQILQWHHLLSLVPGQAYRDPRVQIAADGAFHALMYVLAVVGLILLWTGPERRRSGDPRLWRSVMLGFGGWNIFDAVVFHWILGWHHIKLDTAAPLAWDVIWLVVFGLAPAAVALPRRRDGRAVRQRGQTSLLLTVLVGVSAVWAFGAPKGQATIVLFAPGTTSVEMMSAIAAVDGRLISTDATGQLVTVAMPAGQAGWRLYGHGALLVSSAGPSGCAAWTASS